MSVYQEFVCETCRERHPIPRLASDDPRNKYKEQDAYMLKLKTEHEAKGHITSSYNDCAPEGRRGDDLWCESAFGEEPKLWIKDYYKFTFVNN